MAGLDGLAADMRSLAQRLGSEGARKLTTAAAVAGKKAALDALKADLPSQRLRHLGKKGSKLGAGYDLTGDATAEVKLRPRGAWVLMEKGARRHPIGAGRRTKSGKITGKGKKNAPRRRLRVGNDWATGPVSHPGFGGRNTLTDAVEGITKAVPEAVALELAKVIHG